MLYLEGSSKFLHYLTNTLSATVMTKCDSVDHIPDPHILIWLFRSGLLNLDTVDILGLQILCCILYIIGYLPVVTSITVLFLILLGQSKISPNTAKFSPPRINSLPLRTTDLSRSS